MDQTARDQWQGEVLDAILESFAASDAVTCCLIFKGARVRLAIEDSLEEGLPRTYTPQLYQSKVSAVFEHVFESYQDEGVSVYVRVA